MVGVKTFDIVFVYKSYEKGWVRVESIERDYLDQILAWLNSKNILCFSVSSSLMWKNMLFTIMRDFRAFVHEGGWTKLMSEQVDHAPLHNYQDDGSSVYEPPSSEAETSFSIDIPELADEPPEPGNVIYEEDSISDIAHSSDILDL
jgi:nucleosome binding factor SPN SPT16 subunit